MIYVIGNKSVNIVKIGYTSSSSPKNRLRNIQTGCPFQLELLLFTHGTRKDEKMLHKEFKHLSLSGEWFRYTEEIKSFVEETVIDQIRNLVE